MDLSLKRLEKRFRIFELDEKDIAIGNRGGRGKDEDELDEDLVSALEKPKWYDFRWFGTKNSVGA